jgi:hypothetical protein
MESKCKAMRGAADSASEASGRRGLWALTAIVAVSGIAARAPAEPMLRVESSPTGEVALDARRVPIGHVLNAIAAEDGFEVIMIEGSLTRPLVDAMVEMAPVEDVLRTVLHDRNYAVVYDPDALSVDRVIVLPPSDPRRSRAPAPRTRRGAARRPPQPIVVRQ